MMMSEHVDQGMDQESGEYQGLDFNCGSLSVVVTG